MALDLDDLCTEWDMLHDAAKECPNCEGTGDNEDDDSGCPTCEGTGELTLDLSRLDEDERERFEELRALAGTICNINIDQVDLDDFQSTVRQGVRVVEDVEAYAREYAESVAGLVLDQWPLTCVDWEEAWEGINDNFQTVTFEGTEYHFEPNE